MTGMPASRAAASFSGRPAGILADQRFDAVAGKQRLLARDAERRPGDDRLVVQPAAAALAAAQTAAARTRCRRGGRRRATLPDPVARNTRRARPGNSAAACSRLSTSQPAVARLRPPGGRTSISRGTPGAAHAFAAAARSLRQTDGWHRSADRCRRPQIGGETFGAAEAADAHLARQIGPVVAIGRRAT